MPLSYRLDRLRNKGQIIGLVPTMGALHDGHGTLLEASKKETDVSVCSIFVNPTQFNNPADFNHYPSTIEKDVERLLATGCDLLLLPDKQEMYGQDFTAKHYHLGYLETVLEGKYRPGHFQGVCQAVDRLLDIVAPHILYLGQKDYQQCMVVKKMLTLTRKENVAIRIIPTMRETSGLAMSSRNLRLSDEQRTRATAIYKTLLYLKTHCNEVPVADLKQQGMDILKSAGFEVDYVEIADAATLNLVTTIAGTKTVALIAATLGGIRLIDNMLLN